MSIKPSTLSKDSAAFVFKRAIHGSIPFVASFGLLLLSWFNKQTWVLWQGSLLAATVLLPPFFQQLRQQQCRLPPLTVVLFLFFIGLHLQLVSQGIAAFYHARMREGLELWPQHTLGILFCAALSYHNRLKERAIERGCAPLSCWAFPSQTPSLRRLILLLSHYAAANGLLCWFIVLLICQIAYFFPIWWSSCLSIPIPLFCSVFLSLIGILRLLCHSPAINTFLAQHSLAYTTFFFLLSIAILAFLSHLNRPDSIIPTPEFFNWMSTVIATSTSGQTLTIAGALAPLSLFLLGLSAYVKSCWSFKNNNNFFVAELLLWLILAVSFFSFSRLWEQSYSIASMQYRILYTSWHTHHTNHPLGLILLSLPLYSGLIRQLSSLASAYFFVFIGFITPLDILPIPQPEASMLLLLILVIGNISVSKHIIYACDAPWEACQRSMIKAHRWLFPISFAISALFFAAFLFPKELCLIVIENFGLLFLVSLILITLLEAFLNVEQWVKNWYSMKNLNSSLATI